MRSRFAFTRKIYLKFSNCSFFPVKKLFYVMKNIFSCSSWFDQIWLHVNTLNFTSSVPLYLLAPFFSWMHSKLFIDLWKERSFEFMLDHASIHVCRCVHLHVYLSIFSSTHLYICNQFFFRICSVVFCESQI